MSGVPPTQELPSWLSFSSFTTVDASGHATTEATIVTLPLTYYGPSIPLGTDGVWTYGGLSSPASTSSTPSTTTTLPSSTSTALTTSLSSPISGSSPPLSTSSASTFSSHVTSSTSSSSPNSSGGSLSRSHKLAGNTVAAIVVVVFFVCVALGFGFLLCCRRTRFNLSTAQRIYDDLESRASLVRKRVTRRNKRKARSGREASPQDEELLATEEVSEEPGASIPPRLVSPAPATRPPVTSPQNVGLRTPSSAFTSLIGDDILGATGMHYGSSLFFHENASDPEEPGSVALTPPPRRSTPLSHRTQQDAPLVPPPIIDPDGGRPISQVTFNSNRSTIPSIAYPDSPVSDVDETAALMTATRIRVNSSESVPQPRGFSMGIARLGRLSWFDRTPPDDDPQYHSSASSRQSTESARARRLMAQRSQTSLPVSQGHRYSVHAGSASSGQTVYYDASSRPRSQVSAGALGPDQWGYTVPDILDMPAPPSAAATFSSSGSRPAHLMHPPGLSSGEHENLGDSPPPPEDRWRTVRSISSSRGSVKSLMADPVIAGPAQKASRSNLSKDGTSQLSHGDTSMTETAPLMSGEEDAGTSGARSRAGTYTSLGTSETVVTDASTGAVMHFPSQVWRSSQGEGTWPNDAWTEFPSPGQAKWYGPPSTLERYRAQTGDPGTL